MPDSTEAKTYNVVAATRGGPEIVIGTLVGADSFGAPMVDWPHNPNGTPMPALSTAPYSAADFGRPVAILFAGGDVAQPVVLGVVRQPLDHVLAATADAGPEPGKPSQSANLSEEGEDPNEVIKIDAESLLVSGRKQVVIECGKASITLTRSGKVIIRGEHVLSRSTGANRIKGGAVQLN